MHLDYLIRKNIYQTASTIRQSLFYFTHKLKVPHPQYILDKLKSNRKQNIKKSNNKDIWRETSLQYWKSIDCSYDGMLLGYSHLSQTDLNFSQQFYKEIKIKLPQLQSNSAIDCGAGIGRITKQFLVNHFKTIDILEQCEHFIQKAKQLTRNTNIRHYYCQKLQDFNFQHQYDCIWIQWVLANISDSDISQFLKKAKTHLHRGGVIIVKENVSTNQQVDHKDCTIVRSTLFWKRLFYESQMNVIKESIQPFWPKQLYEVRMYAIQ